MHNKAISTFLGLVIAASLTAQNPVSAGRGSYAAYPPPYKAKTDEHSGFNASKMLTRKIYASETDADGNQRPIPTNDWWTDVINNRYSGALWSYPAMVKTSERGISVDFPTYWNDNGTEVKSNSRITVSGVNFSAAETRALDWHDWDVEILQPASEGSGCIKATLVHGQPFTWFEFTSVLPEITFSETPEIINQTDSNLLIKIGNDLYGFYLPDNVTAELRDGALRADGAAWLSVALLPSEGSFSDFEPYATSIVRNTEVSWTFNESTSELATSWKVSAENLRSPGAQAPVMQGFLPHVYKYASASSIAYTPTSFLTPRGTMKMAVDDSGSFAYSYRFPGILPYYAAPAAGDAAENGYNPEIMRELMANYASSGSFGDDTYWGGKGLTQMALNMTFARQTGHDDLYEQSKTRLKEALTDWLTYTPGEETKFFSYYPRWGAMLGFDVSYDSDAFNDHHFHYGYFLYSAALLCLEDKDFAQGYGEILKMIAKDYANYDRSDTRFPFLRTLDPWAGHSYAGGLGDAGNDNGNGQESSSEAMQGWGGVYLLGVALGDNALRDAGIFGWMTESRGTVEYWFDRDHIYSNRQHNYDYTLYQHPYNTNITSKGIGWWTWFSGDPLWMHSIQWMPVSPCLNYLSEDLNFVKWDYETMIAGTANKWFEDSSEGGPLADQSVGNVVLCYMERYNPAGAAAIFDEAYARGLGIAKSVDTGHISYYVIHHHLTYGDPDFEVTADCPTAGAYRKADGTVTYMVYNPGESERTVRFFRNGAVEKTVKAPARRLMTFTAVAAPARLAITSAEGAVIPPGASSQLTATAFDQYDVTIETDTPQWSVSGSAAITPDGLLTVEADAVRGSQIIVTAESSQLSAQFTVTVNDAPRIVNAAITGLPELIETGSSCTFSLQTTDQYGTVTSAAAAEWLITAPDNSTVSQQTGSFTFQRAGVYTISASAAGATASAILKVLPPLPNIALHKSVTVSSEENAGTLAVYATDGDYTNRWGSAHSDDQWLVIDLGADHIISGINIVWETAHAADYDIETATSDTPDRWTAVVSQRNLGAPGRVSHHISATARYVRLKCLRRATSWGYSLHEIEVTGVPADIAPDDIVGIDIVAPEMMMQGEKYDLRAVSVDFAGRLTELSGVQWSSTPAGEFSGNTFTPLAYGLHTVTAATGTMTSSSSVLVEEATRLAGVTASPSTISLVTGESRVIEIEGLNQFGGIYPIDESTVTASVTDADGTPVSEQFARFTLADGLFTAFAPGEYRLDINGSQVASVTVSDIEGTNLALHKKAYATSAENNGLEAPMAIDGDLSTRWGSTFYDDQAITVDLMNTYMVNRIRICWNKPAFATHYTVECSADGMDYTPVQTRSGWNGDTDDITFVERPVRYVRLTGHKRSTQYGTSVDELEVYGTGVYTSASLTEATDHEYVDVYSLQGILLRTAVKTTELRETLPPGFYIVRAPGYAAGVAVR